MRSKRGQSLVEAAITLPIVLLLSLGMIDLGRTFYYREAASNAARQALRMAVSSYQQSTADSVCSSTSAGPVAKTVSSPLPPSGGSIVTIANQAALESSADGTAAGSVLNGATLTVTFHCLNSVGVTNATGNGQGPSSLGADSITASVTYNLQIVTPPLWPFVGTTLPITASASMRTEY